MVGRSGSRKSTLGSLISCTYQPDSGSVTISGYATGDLHPQWIRDQVSLARQQSLLFNESIFQNIAFGQKDYHDLTVVQVLEACRMVAVEDTIRSELPLRLSFKTD